MACMLGVCNFFSLSHLKSSLRQDTSLANRAEEIKQRSGVDKHGDAQHQHTAGYHQLGDLDNCRKNYLPTSRPVHDE